MKRKTVIIACISLLLVFAFCSVFVINFVKKQLYPREFTEYVEKYSNEFSVPEELVFAVIYCESSFDPDAKSSVGAIGLMQLMPATLDWLSGLLDEESPSGEINDPETNIKYGTFYLSYLYEKFGSWETALAAYNAGHGRVATWLEDSEYSDDGITLKYIPFEETRSYVNRVLSAKEEYYSLYYKNGEK